MDRESFFKGQLESVQKALTKQEVPLKPKHARRLILGTHHEKSCSIFWNNVARIQLEKNPVLTWKFCHLLHKLIRDGHKSVPSESHRHMRRITMLGDFWKHLQTSGYGAGNEQYCKMLCERLEFHRKYPHIPGNLVVAEKVLRSIQNDLDGTFEASIDMLDQMESLLLLQRKVFDSLEMLSWSSLVPQGQTLLAPLILVIMDTSKLYDLLVKLVFHLHSVCPPDALAGHRDRFQVIFRQTKTFYEEASKLQYFKYLVSVPTLPAVAPNFLQASDLECYQAPQAREIGSDSDDGRSVSGDGALLDLDDTVNTRTQLQQLQHSPASLPDQRDEQITSLSRQLEDEKFAKERLIAEARSRIEQYENRLVQMQNEIDHVRREADDNRDEADRVKAALSTRDLTQSEQADARIIEAEGRRKASEDKFVKLKTVYEKFRAEHLAALQKLGDLQRRMEGVDKDRMDREEESRGIHRRLEEAERQRSEYMEKLGASAAGEDELRSQLARADAAADEMRRELESVRLLVAKGAEERREAKNATLAMIERAGEELLNASSVQYPTHLAIAGVTWAQEVMGQESSSGSPKKESLHPTSALSSSIPLSGHALSVVVVACAAAAYTASIQHYDEVNEECKCLLVRAKEVIEKGEEGRFPSLQRLHDLMIALPEVVGSELEEEMRRMDAAIRQAVEKIEEIQRKARENNDGLRLEVNERILGTCQALMAAIAILVQRSRELQAEIVAAGRGQGPPQEFYKRNHQWTEGLLSAAKAVGVAARVLVAAADGVVTGSGKFEQLIVAAQEIAASTAQLFVSSRVKADRDSEKMAALSVASKSVNQATAQVVASVKSGQTTLNEQDALDFTHLTLHEAKKEEMESQVKCLELEASLTRERTKLAQLRKQHYHMASLVAENGGGVAKV
ncbi:hipr-1 [Pristionchus pacificus]|nr:hipr-1 [Pristionchus pacificus]|eukprot:PDM65884.1 hipr-1 [Pristionchus pacificus]